MHPSPTPAQVAGLVTSLHQEIFRLQDQVAVVLARQAEQAQDLERLTTQSTALHTENRRLELVVLLLRDNLAPVLNYHRRTHQLYQSAQVCTDWSECPPPSA